MKEPYPESILVVIRSGELILEEQFEILHECRPKYSTWVMAVVKEQSEIS